MNASGATYNLTVYVSEDGADSAHCGKTIDLACASLPQVGRNSPLLLVG